MIAYITGTLIEFTEDSCLVLTGGGVGYELRLTAPALSRLPQKGADVAYFVQAVIREDAFDLYGFDTFEERSLFQVLTSISRLGPKKALAILSRFQPDELHRIVYDEDLAALSSVSGIGKKTGQQILLELKFKLGAEGAIKGRTVAPPQAGGVFSDALTGLKNLGYSEEEAAPVLRKILEKDAAMDVTEAMRTALKTMAAERS